MKYIFILLFVSCATHRIGNDAAGIFIAKYSSLDREDALKTTQRQAENHCDGERVLIVSKNIRYEGKNSESENQKIKDDANASIMLGKGGMDQAKYATKGDNLYHVEIRFRCK